MFVLIVLVWFYVLALIVLGGRGGQRADGWSARRPGTLADMPDPKTEELRLEQLERERRSSGRPTQADDEPATEHRTSAAPTSAAYLREKLAERAEAEDAAAREG